MRFTDRSRTETDWTCPRARYWSIEYEGRGLSPVALDSNLAFGISIATQAEAIRQGRGIAVPPSTLVTAPQHALCAGLTEAYATRIWPTWLEQFELVATECECTFALTPDIMYQARPDAVLRRKSDGTFWYLEDKTTSQNQQTFGASWDKQVQLHATCIAIEKQLGVEMAGCYVQGWYKGYQKNGTIYSPLAYAWCKRGQPGLSTDHWTFEYKAGWERRPITDMSVATWVASLPAVVIQEQFPVAGPIMLNRQLAASYLADVTHREHAIGYYAPGRAPLRLFPQHFMHCDDYGKYRRPCAYRECCWSPTVAQDPIGSDLFVLRQPHHEAEADYMNGKIY